MATLTIRWQRLVDESGRTCVRCGTTGESVEEAYRLLKQSLAPLGLEVELQRIAIDRDTFAKNPIESNRIWIGDDSLEDLLGAKVGQSRCCSVCGESECRTVTVDGETHEGITAPLIVKAGLTAAARTLHGSSSSCGPSCGGDRALDAAASKEQTGCCESADALGKKSPA
jgi:hypothetical protein